MTPIVIAVTPNNTCKSTPWLIDRYVSRNAIVITVRAKSFFNRITVILKMIPIMIAITRVKTILTKLSPRLARLAPARHPRSTHVLPPHCPRERTNELSTWTRPRWMWPLPGRICPRREQGRVWKITALRVRYAYVGRMRPWLYSRKWVPRERSERGLGQSQRGGFGRGIPLPRGRICISIFEMVQSGA